MPSMQNGAVTAEQLELLREPGVRFELVRGELRRMSPAGYWHGGVVARLTGLLEPHVRSHDLGMVFGAETGFLLARDPDTLRAPDVAFVRRERLPREPAAGFFPGAPDLAVEVVSPNDAFADVQEKALSWLVHGTLAVWVVEPRTRSVTIHQGAKTTLLSADHWLESPLLPHFGVRVADLFPSAPPPARA